ncbi:MAG TPA: cupin domain-containing protein [Candidatus Hydrogenedentes bacterium]|nr:cupin domain-containing protein [Candidatus Hydrogenedentota bacterium]HIJ72889.1 cupin domain-containing protein [Candidatus Hydrogenedentota bacterium]
MAAGTTPYHTHDYEHLVQVKGGRGVVVDERGERHELAAGYSVFVAPNEKHRFANPFSEPFVFACAIPNPNISCAQSQEP